MPSIWPVPTTTSVPWTRGKLGLSVTAGGVVMALAIVGVGLGIRAAWRDAGAPDVGGPADNSGDTAMLVAKPIVTEPPPVVAPTNVADPNAQDAEDADQAKADALAEKAAAAQEIQAKPSKPSGNIDDILASPTEKPPAPVKPAADEAPPPVKSDVPF